MKRTGMRKAIMATLLASACSGMMAQTSAGDSVMTHASGKRLKRRLEFHLLSVQKDIAAVSAGIADYIHSEKDFHQGGLAGAVFADQAEHFAFPQGKVDVRQYLIAEEILLDVLHFQKRCALTHLHSVLII